MPAGLPKLSTSEKIVGAAAALKSGPLRARIARAASAIAADAAAGSVGATAAGLGGIALAGTLAYFITKYVLERPDRARASLQENAARAADAYRAARLKIAADQGRALSPGQQKQLARFFQAELQKLGLTKDDLSALRGRGFVPRTGG